jgi:hypothetical protein
MISKINPEKSNKMIYAVVIGLGIVFVGFLLLVTGGTPADGKGGLMAEVLNYLKKTQGIEKLEMMPESNTVQIRYDSQDPKDFVKIAAFAGIKLSLRLKKELVKVELFKDNGDMPEKVIFCRDGRILEDNPEASPDPNPAEM